MTRSTKPQTSKEHVIACLTKLRVLVNWSPRTEDAAKLTMAAMADELQFYPSQAVTAGCLEWGRQKATWPALAQLIEYIDYNDSRAQALSSETSENYLVRLKRLSGHDALWVRERHDLVMELFPAHCAGTLTDAHLEHQLRERIAHFQRPEQDQSRLPADGVILRNEAITLLGMFYYDAQNTLQPDGPAWSEFIAEAGRMWARVRPNGGLAEVDREHRRIRYGFALEAWARWYLRVKPLNAAYITPATREIYTQMTGREIETEHKPAPEPGPFTAAMTNLVPDRPSP